MSLERFEGIETVTVTDVFENSFVIPLEGSDRSSIRIETSFKVRLVGYHTSAPLIAIFHAFDRLLNKDKWDVSLGHLGDAVYIQGQGKSYAIREYGGFGEIIVSSSGSDLEKEIWSNLENFAAEEVEEGLYDVAIIQRIAGKLNSV